MYDLGHFYIGRRKSRCSRKGRHAEVTMGLRPTEGDENPAEWLAVRYVGRGIVKAVFALGESRPFLSLARNVRFEPINVSLPFPS